jgi:uncharacterized RDD family membrane protein YckC
MALGVDLVPFVVAARFVGAWAGLAAALYFVLCHRLAGQTLGKWLLRLQVTDGEGRRIGWRAALVRTAAFAWAPAIWVGLGLFVYFMHRDEHITFQIGRLTHAQLVEPLAYAAAIALTFVGYLAGFLLAVFHPKHRALHDLLAHTEVTLKPRARRK